MPEGNVSIPAKTAKLIEGQTIKSIAVCDVGNYRLAPVLQLENGKELVIMCDPEGNNGGAIHIYKQGDDDMLDMLSFEE